MEKSIKLPPPLKEGRSTFEAVLSRRRSGRDLSGAALSLNDVSQLLWAGQGISDNGFRRTAPSAGALYPATLHLVAGNVETLPPGVYKYDPANHALTSIADGDKREELSVAAIYQESIRRGACSIVISADHSKILPKYGERAMRYLYMEAGHISENIYLQASSLELGTVAVGAFYDETIKNILMLDDNELLLYIMPVGTVL